MCMCNVIILNKISIIQRNVIILNCLVETVMQEINFLYLLKAAEWLFFGAGAVSVVTGFDYIKV